ncbi:uncharacterized protein FIESC28_05407 [Fusarium coffeatum]|uniref:Uncharacterized protein n=1 Tax=Fusarium coffeatum TaxID=231269 RepID=A0A366RU58_9HYPO|nr:uncharacterized protein FIESC28_05407 [Fusarium coffeatum]RBR20128.1 hypothetical protein FIESC28_05407 [Fusarium coffeatum]
MDYEEIDPDGDTLIIIHYLARTSRSANELVVAEKPSTEESIAADNVTRSEEITAFEEPAIEESAFEEPAIEESAIEEPAITYETGHDGCPKSILQ